MAKLDVVIPAGGVVEQEFARVIGTDSKALVKFDEVSVLRRTIEALRASPVVGRIVVVGSKSVVDSEDAKLADIVLPATGSGPTNIMVGIEHLAGLDLPPHQVLIVTVDLPFLTTEGLHNFLNLCTGEMDLYVPLISLADWEEAYPGAEATFVRLLDGHWTTGCMYLMTVRGFKVAKPHIEAVFAKRKSKLGMAALLGPKFVWDYFNKKLTVTDIEKKITQMVKINGTAVPGSPPELAFDIDYLEDYHYALGVFKTRASKRAAEAAQEGEAAPTQ